MESTLYAMAPNPGAQGQGAAPAGPAASLFSSPLPLLLLIMAFFYFIMLRPQQKAEKERKALIRALKSGDQVVLSSGIYATVVKVNEDDTLILKVAEGVNVRAARHSVDTLAKK